VETDHQHDNQVQKAQVMRDPHTHESRGFGFVTMESAAEADAAVAALNGQDFLGKTLVIEKACSLSFLWRTRH
jgi:transformer-2 protein